MNIQWRIAAVTMIALVQGWGCANRPVNPSFNVSMIEAKVAWTAMAEEPAPLPRPVIVLGGIYDPGVAARFIARRIEEVAGPDAHVIHLGFLDTGSFDRSARKAIDAVNEHFKPQSGGDTIEVDVIGVSMGGLVARYAASQMYFARTGQRLNIHRLFTISSPHRGAKLAWVPTFDKRIIDMRSGSEFLAALNAEARPYELFPYARLGDQVVGESNSAPPGVTPWWIAPSRGLSHGSAYADTRILADIARRLRDETPLTADSPKPLPDSSGVSSADAEVD